MGDEKQAGGTFYPKLNDAVTYPTLAARKDDILNQYDKMLEILADEGNFLVVDTYWEKDEKHYPTFGRCEFKKGVWTPLETFFTSSTSSCSNQALDHIIRLVPVGDMLTLTPEGQKKPKTKVRYSKSK